MRAWMVAHDRLRRSERGVFTAVARKLLLAVVVLGRHVSFIVRQLHASVALC